MSNNRHGGKSVRFNEGSQQTGSSRHHRREDERDSGLAADRHYQSNNPDALREAYDTLLAQNQSLQDIISKKEASLSTSHRTIKQLESHTAGLVAEKDELKAKNNDYKDEIKGYKAENAKLQSENDALQRDNMELQIQVADLREQMFMRSVVSDQMSGASGASGTSGSSSNKISRRPSQRESQDERLKDRLNRSTQNNAQVASASAIPPTSQRQRRLSKVTLPGRPYIEEPEPRYNLVARPAPGPEQARVPRSSHQTSGDYQNPGDYQFHPLPQEPPRRR